jgi:CBS domain-containing protein
MSGRVMAEIVKLQKPVTLPVGSTVQEACKLMRDRRIGAILVTDEKGHLRGLFTGRDAVCRIIAEARDPTKTPLGSVMTANPDTIKPGAHAIEVLRMMSDGGYRHMPVVDGDVIMGIVSRGDFRGLETARLDDETGLWEIM